MKGATLEGKSDKSEKLGSKDRPFTRAFIDFDNLVDHPDNPRQHIDKKKVAELAASIGEVGILDDLLTRQHPDQKGKWQILGGHRRKRAGILAGKTGAECKIYDVDDKVALEIMLAENLERENLTPFEESGAVLGLQAAGWPMEAIAQHLGKSPAWAYKRASLTSLSPAWKKFLKDDVGAVHAFPASTLEAIARLHVDSQEKIASKFREAIEAGEILTEANINAEAAHFAHELRLAPWNPEDATLDPKAGACTLCDKRTSCRRVLFEELKIEEAESGKIPKGDQCLDAACFANKLRLYRRRRVVELKAAAKEAGVKEPLRVLTPDYHDAEAAGKQKLGADVERGYGMTPAKASDPHAIPLYNLAADKLEYRVEQKHAPKTRRTASGAVEAPGLRSLASRRKDLEARRIAYVVKGFAAWLSDSEPEDTLSDVLKATGRDYGYLAILCLLIANRTGLDPYGLGSWTSLLKMKSGKAAVESVWENLVSVMATELVSFGHNTNEQLAKQKDTLETMATLLGLGPRLKEFHKKAIEEIPEPKSWAHLRADGTPKAPKGKKAAGKKPRKAKKLEAGDVELGDGRVSDGGG